MKRRSCSGRALDSNIAAHRASQIAADAQPESEPLDWVVELAVSLLEGVKDRLELFGRDPDAGIAHADMDQGLITLR